MKNYFKASTVKPDRAETTMCFEIMSRIDDLVPSDAKVYAVINRLSDGSYHTMIPVHASDERFADGRFYAEGRTRSLVTSLKAAQTEILTKLREWKADRFERKSQILAKELL